MVWRRCYDALVPGGRLVCVVGDVCLSRRQNDGRHTVVPLHASIQECCRKIGFDNLAPIIWHKIANAVYEASGAGGFLGKPYEPNSVIKNDIEFILMFRKPGGYRKPNSAARLLSVIGAEDYQQWFQQIWTGLTGESTRAASSAIPSAACGEADSDVQLCRGYGPGPVFRDRLQPAWRPLSTGRNSHQL